MGAVYRVEGESGTPEIPDQDRKSLYIKPPSSDVSGVFQTSSIRGNILGPMDLNTEPSLSEATDEQLVTLYRSGRDEAFEALLGRYRQELFHFLMRFTGSRAAAEDVFQEAFLQIHISIV